MKTHTILPYLTGLLLSALVLSGGCTKHSDDEPGTSGNGIITLTTLPPVFEAAGGDAAIIFHSTADWTAEVDQTWGSVSPNQGKAGDATITLHVDKNASGGERNATLILHSGSTSERLVFYQKQENALTVTSSRFEVAQAGRDITVEVVANISFEYEVEEEASEWLIPIESRAMETTLLHFQVKPNDSPRKRVGNIEIRSRDLTETVTVYQDGEEPQIILSEESPVVGSDGGTLTVELRSNLDYDIQLPDQPDWLREITTRTISTYTHRFEVDPNEGYDNRTTRIVFTDAESGTSQTVTVTQMQRNAILISEERYTLDAAAGTLDFKVNTNVDFEVTTSEEWIREAPGTRAMEERSLKFTVDANPDETPREATIRLSADGVEQTIRVYQAGLDGTGILRITHTNAAFALPTFTGLSTLLYGTISWGDGAQEEYREGLSHTYRSGSSHTVTIEMTGATTFTLPDLIGITELDLTQF